MFKTKLDIKVSPRPAKHTNSHKIDIIATLCGKTKEAMRVASIGTENRKNSKEPTDVLCET